MLWDYRFYQVPRHPELSYVYGANLGRGHVFVGFEIYQEVPRMVHVLLNHRNIRTVIEFHFPAALPKIQFWNRSFFFPVWTMPDGSWYAIDIKGVPNLTRLATELRLLGFSGNLGSSNGRLVWGTKIDTTPVRIRR